MGEPEKPMRWWFKPRTEKKPPQIRFIETGLQFYEHFVNKNKDGYFYAPAGRVRYSNPEADLTLWQIRIKRILEE